MRNNQVSPIVAIVKRADGYLLGAVRYSFPAGFFLGLAVDIFSALGLFEGFASADCAVMFSLQKWPNESRYFIMLSAIAVLLASVSHGLIYGEYLVRGSKTSLFSSPQNQFSCHIKRAYLVALVPVSVMAGFFLATILLSELLNRPGAINHGC